MRRTSVKNRNNSRNTANTGVLRRVKNAISRNKLGETLVLLGKISPYDLKTALKIQKTSHQPLGLILIEQNKISRQELTLLLLRQKILRITATTMIFIASICIMAKRPHAAEIVDVPAKIALADTANEAFKSINHHPKLFGAKEKRSNNLSAFTKWTEMFERFDVAIEDKKSQRTIQKLQNSLAKYKSPSIHEMAKNVNKIMNKKKYIDDSENWGKSDYWATPVEFLTRGGDCEDFAIAKYVALRILGVPENRMRVAIVQDQKKNIPHAVLVVYSEKGTMILDNQNKTMLAAKSINHYKPIFSINREAWWLHTTPDEPTTILATAAR